MLITEIKDKNKAALTDDDFRVAAAKLRCDIASIKAVSEVESRGKAFYADGFPTILFERHKFHRFTRGEYDGSHPEISNAKAGGYGAAGQHQRDKFNLAFSLDPLAAMKSCSWGKFQIMGFNYELCGFDSVGAFVDAMKSGEPAQLDAFVRLIINTGLGDELRNRKWAAFAESYNGENYRINKYDKKLAAAYQKFSTSVAVHPNHFADLSDTEIHDLTNSLSGSNFPDTGGASPADNPSEIIPPITADLSARSFDDQDAPPVNITTEFAAASNGDQTLVTGQTTTEPAGDLPDAEPRWHFEIEDLKPFCQKWLKRIWSGFGGSNTTIQTVCGIGAKFGGEYWWIFLLAGIVFLLGSAFVALVGSAVIGLIFWKNRGELERAKTFVAESIRDPKFFNIAERVIKKGLKK